MKKRITAMIIILSLAVVFVPSTSLAAVTPYFMAVNDALLPFTDENMPLVINGEIFVPDRVLEGAGVFSIVSVDRGQVRLYRGGGASRSVDFYTAIDDIL